MASRKRGFSQLEGGIDWGVPHSKKSASSRDIIIVSDDEDEQVLSTLDIPIRYSISWHSPDRLRWPKRILERKLPVIVDKHLKKVSNFQERKQRLECNVKLIWLEQRNLELITQSALSTNQNEQLTTKLNLSRASDSQKSQQLEQLRSRIQFLEDSHHFMLIPNDDTLSLQTIKKRVVKVTEQNAILSDKNPQLTDELLVTRHTLQLFFRGIEANGDTHKVVKMGVELIEDQGVAAKVQRLLQDLFNDQVNGQSLSQVTDLDSERRFTSGVIDPYKISVIGVDEGGYLQGIRGY